MFLQIICIGLIFHSVNHVVCFNSTEPMEVAMGNLTEEITEDSEKESVNAQCTHTMEKAIDDLEKIIKCSKEMRCPDPLHPVIQARSSNVPSNCFRPMDCAEILQGNSSAESGVYTIWLRPRFSKSASIEVYCDMKDDGGGWTVIQRRGDFGAPQQYFYKDWEAYKNGFGVLEGDFWLGNEIIHALTNQHFNSLKFILEDWEGTEEFAIYDEFRIDDEFHNYTAHVTGYHGNAGDSFNTANNAPFSTKDRDNDLVGLNCAEKYKGAWWYSNCGDVHLNALYLRGRHKALGIGVGWYGFRGLHYSLKYTTMKIRPKLFQRPDLPDK